MKEVDELVEAGSDVIALDCTDMKRGDGKTVDQFITEVRTKYPDAILMADISTYEEGVRAWKLGMDIVGTTMSGYTSHSPKLDGPDYELVTKLSQTVDIPVIGEGRVHSPEEAVKMLDSFNGKDQMVAPAILGAAGNCYAQLGQLDKAASTLMSAADKADNNTLSPIFLMQAGEILVKQGKYDDAVDAYTKIKDKYFQSYQAMDIDKYIEQAKLMKK